MQEHGEKKKEMKAEEKENMENHKGNTHTNQKFVHGSNKYESFPFITL